MALTLSQIFSVSAPAVLQKLGKPYYFTPVRALETMPGYVCSLINPQNGATVPVVWSREDEVKNPKEYEKINFVTSLIENAVDWMDFYSVEPEVEDVIF